MHSNGTLPLDSPLDARCGYTFKVMILKGGINHLTGTYNQWRYLIKSRQALNKTFCLDIMLQASDHEPS